MEKQKPDRMNEAVRENQGIDLEELMITFFRLLGKFWWMVVGFVIVITGVYSVYTYAGYHPMYECRATFTVATGNEESGNYNFYYAKGTAAQLQKTFPYILNSTYFKSVLAEAVGTSSINGTLTATVLEESNVVTMTVHSPNAEQAKEILDAALLVYPETARFVLGTLQFHLIDQPEVPEIPYNKPNLMQVVMKGIAVSAFFSALVLGILSLFRKTAKTPDEMKEITNLKCLAALPMIKVKARRNGVPRMISVLDQRTSYGYIESIRALQIRVERELAKEDGKVLMIASTASGEGKSALAISLAEMFASKGKKVLLIDADLRKQNDAELLGCGDGAGLRDLMEKEEGVHLSVRKLHDRNFWFVGSGRPQQNPASVLSHPEFPRFMERMRRKMDYIILDTPPCGDFQDVSILEEYADGIVYVVKYDFISRRKILEGLSSLGHGKAKVLGYIFNSYPESGGSYGYGRYGYGKYGYGKYGYGHYGYKAKEYQSKEDGISEGE